MCCFCATHMGYVALCGFYGIPRRKHTKKTKNPQPIGIQADALFCGVFVSCCYTGACKGKNYVRCRIFYIRHNFFYIGRSFSYILCNFRSVWERASDYGVAIIVGAYCIRPVHRRLTIAYSAPANIANHRRDIAKRRNSGRMQYAPTAVQFVDL